MRPSRTAHRDAVAKAGRAPQMSVFYHRVANTHPNDWTLSNAQFERHLNHFEAEFEWIGLGTLQQRVAAPQCASLGMSITFDDGYADNLDFAIPELLRRRIPTTYFVSSGHVRSGRPFLHDQECGVPLAVNTPKHIREIADAGIEIGGHTRDHIDCGSCESAAKLGDQIRRDKLDLEDMIGRPVRFFAFPFGTPRQITPAAIRCVADAGYKGFCSAFGGYNLLGRGAFHIRRFHGDPSFGRILNWTSFDPGKIESEPAIDYPAALKT